MRPTGQAALAHDVPAVVTTRTLANSHRCLLDVLEPGMAVLDVGCGPGTLTIEIARRVRPGSVVGMDVNRQMIAAAEAASPPGDIPNLVFYRGDIRESGWDAEFDLVNAARVLQWIAQAEGAIRAMARAARPGGLVVVLDYDHARAEWSRPPAAWTRFYQAFLEWRTASGLDNAIIERVPSMCAAAGLVDIRVTPLTETVQAGAADFLRVVGRWRLIADSRGRHMVASGHLGEDQRRAGVEAFTGWMQTEGAMLTIHEACVVALRPTESRP